MNKFKKRFSEFTKNGSYQRIDEAHSQDWYLGLNENGKDTILIMGTGVVKNIDSSKLIDVKMFCREDKKIGLSFSLIDPKFSDLFYQFSNDIIECSRHQDEKSGFDNIIERWNSWRNMFKNQRYMLLKESEIRGLLGELIFLKEFMFEKYDQLIAIKSWIGTSRSHKDFEIEDTWFEIKTVVQNALTVKISSIEQLDSEIIGNLVLITLEKSNEAIENPILLNSYIKYVHSLIKSEEGRELFERALSNVGYFYTEEYDKYIYSKKKTTFYTVDNNFPKIRAKDLPNGIVRIGYEILLNNISQFIKGTD